MKGHVLAELPAGAEGTVAGIDASDPARIHRLASLGILPGARIRLVRSGSVFLAVLDGSQVAFDREVARSIWVHSGK